jgi:uncharacterized protein (DUF1330 family)
MAAYIVVTRWRTRNPAELELYRDQASASLNSDAIKWLARFGPCEVKEGPAAEAVGILEFATLNEAKAWYASPAYQKALQHRFMAADYSFIIVEGAAPN